MKKPFVKQTVHYVSDDLSTMLTVITLRLFGIPVFRKSKKKTVAVAIF